MGTKVTIMVTIIKKLTRGRGDGKRSRKRRNGEKKGGRKREGGKDSIENNL